MAKRQTRAAEPVPREFASGPLWVAGGVLATSIAIQSILPSPTAFAGFGSMHLWTAVVEHLGGQIEFVAGQPESDVSLLSIVLATAIIAAILWILGAAVIRRTSRRPYRNALDAWGRGGGRWWLLPGAWEALRLIAFVLGLDSLHALLNLTAPLWFAVALAGSLTVFLTLAWPDGEATENAPAGSPSPRPLRIVVIAAVSYTVVFTAMNWQLWFGLLIPHGDSAMYEEHLWNLLHGKGFRSYLDQGLFLGEHIQVIHALLIPLYALWPSHLLLELCESAALASGAVATFFLARRHSGSDRAATWMAFAYLLAIPMQFLDIAIDGKTFRPTAFVIPLLLFALDQFERGRWKTMLVLLAITLSAQEDLALVLAPLGVWMAVRGGTSRNLGVIIAVVATAYLLLALLVLIPHFRAGSEVHYTSYFGDLGHSPAEIAKSVFTKPAAFFGKLLSARSLMYAALLLLPYGLLPLRGWDRLLVAAPLFAILCLMDTSTDPAEQGKSLLIPFHHFHAPLVPILVWAAAASLAPPGFVGRVARPEALRRAWPDVSTDQDGDGPAATSTAPLWRARLAACCALSTGLTMSLSPLGVPFWDSGSPWHWRTLYVPGVRAEMFPRVFEQIPLSARVASTDFVHPRFTHHERSYDYSAFRRSVAGYENRVPDDTDYIVIDTRHKYSAIKSPAEVRELREEPDRWELLPDATDGCFIVLRRRK